LPVQLGVTIFIERESFPDDVEPFRDERDQTDNSE
jgi:hypothetical protein